MITCLTTRLNHYYDFKRKTASHTNVAYTTIRNSQQIAILPNVQIFFVQIISFATFGVSIDDFFTRYAGLGYSLYNRRGFRKIKANCLGWAFSDAFSTAV